jgi:hypothetical protein
MISTQELLTKHKNSVINAVVLVIAAFIAMNLFRVTDKSYQELKNKQTSENKKNIAYESVSVLEKRIIEQKAVFGTPKDMSLVFSNISTFAKNSGVKVNLIKPLFNSSFPAYTKYLFEVDVNCPDYHKIGAFVSEMENSGQGYLIDEINVVRRLNYTDKAKVDPILVARLKIASIILKDIDEKPAKGKKLK